MQITFKKAEFPCIASWHVNICNYQTVDHYFYETILFLDTDSYNFLEVY